MRIDPDNRSTQGLQTFLSFVGLNLCYLVACLPVVTIPAATSALFEVTRRYADHERGELIKDFFPTLGRNARQASLLGLMTLGPAALLGFSAVFWAQSAGVPAGIAMVVSILAALYFLAVFLVAMALLAHYRNTVRQTFRNAMLLPLAEPTRTLGVAGIAVVQGVFTVLFPPFAILVTTIGASFGAYVAAFLFRAMFARHTPGEEADGSSAVEPS